MRINRLHNSRMGSLVFLLLAMACAEAVVHTIKTRGVYTTMFIPELSPLRSFDLPGSAYEPSDNFGPNDIPVAIIVGFADTDVTMSLVDSPTGTPIASRDTRPNFGKAAVLPLFINRTGPYELQLIVNKKVLDSYKFVVTRAPLSTNGATINLDAALGMINQRLQVDPEDGPALILRGSIHADKREFAEAVQDYSHAIRIRTHDATTHLLRAEVYWRTRQWNDAIADWDEFTRLRPQDPRGIFGRAVIEEHQSEFGKAIASLREAIRIQPEYAGACNELAWILATCPDAPRRNGKEAVRLAAKACELTGSKRWSYLGTLAAAHAEKGDFEAAVKYQNKALALPDMSAQSREWAGGRLLLYAQKSPYHQPTNRPAGSVPSAP